MHPDSTYTLTARTNEVFIVFKFFALHDDEAIFAAIDLILAKNQQRKEPWLTGRIILTNPIGVFLLTVPSRELNMVDDDEYN